MLSPTIDLDLGQGVITQLALIPSQTFWMGARGYATAEEPRHAVHIPYPYYLGTTPVTEMQFARSNPNALTSLGQGDQPMTEVTWQDAIEYCDWLNGQLQSWVGIVPDGYQFCLPSEAQWECACRAGSDMEYCNGDGEAALASVGWFGMDANTGFKRPVGQLLKNAYELYDMHGNVWEWCADVFDEHAYKKRPNGWWDEVLDGGHSYHVLRGGSFHSPAPSCRSAVRNWRGWKYAADDTGFRVCLSNRDGLGGPDSL